MECISNSNDIKKYYKDSQLAEKYLGDRFSHPLGRVLHEKQVKTVNRYIEKYKLQKILELACGPARITMDIIPLKDSKCVAVDFSEEMLKIAEKRSNFFKKCGWIFFKQDIFKMDLKEQFDLIFSYRFIRHFMREDRTTIYNQVHRHLKKGGYFIFDVVNKEVSLPVRIKEGLKHYPVYDELYNRDEFLVEMEKEGFFVKELINTHPLYPLLYKIQLLLGPHLEKITYNLLKFIENNFKKRNLEWIAVCQAR